MSILDMVETGKKIGAQINVIAGINGVGKTTFTASFPDALIIDLEDGSKHLNVNRIPSSKVPTLVAFRSLIKDLIANPRTYKSVAIDSAEALEGLIADGVCLEGKVTSIELYEGGYGKGFSRTREIMREIFLDFKALRDTHNITVNIVAHTQVKPHTDPATNATYDRVIMRCNDKMAALIRDLSDNVFYATYKVLTMKENGKTKAFGDGQRIMYTQWRPGFDAKNRLELPLELPLSYDAFMEACSPQAATNSEEILEDIKQMSENLDEKMKITVKEQVEKFKGNALKLKEIKNRLMKYQAA